MSGPDLWRLARKLVFTRPPEEAHGLALRALQAGLVPPGVSAKLSRPRLACMVAGLRFANPLGMAAGFDKNGEVAMQLLAQGFGFTEIGTTTPRPQAGNAKPRVFRLVEDEAMINRLGFNNEGHEAMTRRLQALPAKGRRAGVIGVNIGANKDSEDRVADYVLGIERFAGLADYITINISSPNTPGLRDLQGADALVRLLDRALDARERSLTGGQRCPLFVKIAPDLDEEGLAASLSVIEASPVEGVIVSNTTNARPAGLRSANRGEVGGLSGRPLFQPSTAMLARVKARLGNAKALIGVGGVDSAATAFAKLQAGADLVQLYTGYVFRGPGLIGDILAALDTHVDKPLDSASEPS